MMYSCQEECRLWHDQAYPYLAGRMRYDIEEGQSKLGMLCTMKEQNLRSMQAMIHNTLRLNLSMIMNTCLV